MLEERGANITEAHALIHNGHLIQYSFPSACIRVTSCYALMLGIQEPSLNQTLQLEDVIVAVGSLTGCATESVGWRNRHSDLFAGVSSLVRPRSNAARCANIPDLRTPHLRHSATRLARRPRVLPGTSLAHRLIMHTVGAHGLAQWLPALTTVLSDDVRQLLHSPSPTAQPAPR